MDELFCGAIYSSTMLKIVQKNNISQDLTQLSVIMLTMTVLHAQIVLHFREPALSRALNERRRAGIEKLLALSGVLQMHYNGQLLDVRIRELTETEIHHIGITWDQSPVPHIMRDRFILLEVDVPFDLGRLSENQKSEGLDLDSDKVLDLARFLVSSDLTKFGGDLLLAGILANPGALEPVKVSYLVDGRTTRVEKYSPSTFYESCEHAAKLSWPPLKVLALADCIAWLRKIPGFEDGVPTGAAGRAVSAVSHVMTNDQAGSPGAALLWYMVGLESLYTSGKEGLSQQLHEKSQVLLGSVNAHKKTFRGLYSYRSSFIHGGLDIPLSYTPYDALPKFERLQEDAYNAHLVAGAFLIATLQAMVQAQTHELRFEWVLRSTETHDD